MNSQFIQFIDFLIKLDKLGKVVADLEHHRNRMEMCMSAMKCSHCRKLVDPKKGGIIYPFTEGKDAHYYCGWGCLLGKLDETLMASRKLIEHIKELVH